MCPPPEPGDSLAGRVALVTGAGRRVGRAIALALGARGMRVVVHFNGSRDGADETARLIRDAGGEAQPSYSPISPSPMRQTGSSIASSPTWDRWARW